jgi:hypothetical protein
MQIQVANCYKRRCKHYKGFIELIEDELVVNYCNAFLKGIPDEISYGSNEHNEPFKDQGNDIVFEKKV